MRDKGERREERGENGGGGKEKGERKGAWRCTRTLGGHGEISYHLSCTLS